jgi:nondiscriminating glutamyl-tRNA synthetase
MIRVRYAPSPTGEIHVGNARTALFNYLFARHNKGTFILRLDDTDKKRSTDQAIRSMVEDITWFGIDWDEGYLKGGDYGPYSQSERMDLYNHYTDILLKEGSAYELHYTDEEIQSIKEQYEESMKTFSYRKVKELETEARVREFKEKGLTPAVVFKVLEDKEIVVDDIVRGDVHFSSNEFKDFVIRRSNGIPVYNYATVIDDALMNITHVIRAEEHLSNTPKQILIFDALKFPHPYFAHISLIFAPDRTKLSKRHGATSIGDFRRMGFLPEAMFNFLALLGWSPKDNREFFTKEELIELFTLESVNKAPAIFDISKLKWMNHKYIVELGKETLCTLAMPYLKEAYPDIKCDEKTLLLVDTLKGNMNVLPDIVKLSEPFLKGLGFPEDEEEKNILFDKDSIKVFKYILENIENIEFEEQKTNEFLNGLKEKLGLSGKKTYHPLRVTLFGSKSGPELWKIFILLGKEEVVQRIKFVLEQIKKTSN